MYFIKIEDNLKYVLTDLILFNVYKNIVKKMIFFIIPPKENNYA
jgi:hypothetical protein